MAPPHRTPLLVVAGAALLAAYVLSEAFAVTTSPKALSPPRLSAQAVGAGLPAQHSSEGYGAVGGAMCGAVAALLAAGGLAVRSQRKSRSLQCNAFSSSSSGFMGTPCASSYVWNHQAAPQPQQPVQAQSGVASMGMKAQVWWIRNNGYDGPAKGGAKLWDSRRRESRRRGEELFRHDVDNFELCVHNLLAAPGSNKRRIQRGRGKYGHHGRTCGYGSTKNGAAKRGRRTLNPGYEGNQKPLHLKTPKLTKDQRDSMKQDPYTPITFWVLNMCEDGDEVDYMDLFMRGLPVPSRKKFDRVKIKANETDELTVKNLTVFAHAFEPAAREKIEENGGRCIRLSDVGSLPIDAKWMSTNEFKVGAGDDSKEEAEGEEAPAEE